MSAYLGDFRVGKTVRKMWNSNAVAGESITRGTNGTISVYKDGGTTQSTTGVTDTEDFDSLTGVHLVAIDTSADGTFYSAGSEFEVVLSAAGIDSKTVNATLFSFSLENRSALMPTTDGRKLDVSAGGEAGVDWANVGSPTTTLNLSGTTVGTATALGATALAAIWDRATSALTTVGSIGKLLVDNVNATISSRLASASITLSSGKVTVGTNDDKTGYALSAAGVQAIWDALTSALTTASSIGKLLVDNLNASISSVKALLPSALTSDGNIKADALRVDGNADAATRLKRGTLGTVLGTVGSGSTTTSVVASSLAPASAVDDQFNGKIITFDKDTSTAALRGQSTNITDFDHTGQAFTVAALTTAPSSGDTFTIS